MKVNLGMLERKQKNKNTESLLKLKQDIETKRLKDRMETAKLRSRYLSAFMCRLQDPDQLYKSIQKYIAKRSLQTRQSADRLSPSQIEERNRNMYDNIRKGMTHRAPKPIKPFNLVLTKQEGPVGILKNLHHKK